MKLSVIGETNNIPKRNSLVDIDNSMYSTQQNDLSQIREEIGLSYLANTQEVSQNLMEKGGIQTFSGDKSK